MVIFAVDKKTNITMGKSTHFFGQPVYGQLIKSLDREKIIEMSRQNGGEKYVKSFNGFTHLLTMLYAVIMRFDSLREIEAAMTAEVRKLHHIGIDKVPKRSTLSDANAIKVQIWVTLIANLLLSLLQISLERRWSFSGLATMVRILLMEYLNMNDFFNMPDADMKRMIEDAAESPPESAESE